MHKNDIQTNWKTHFFILIKCNLIIKREDIYFLKSEKQLFKARKTASATESTFFTFLFSF